MEKLKIALVDDHQASREKLATTLALLEEVEVVWTAGDGAEALAKYQAQPQSVQVFLLDVEMPVMNGLELCAALRAKDCEAPILMLSVSDKAMHLEQALQAGANGYLLKGESPRVISRMLREVADGRLAFSPEMAQKTLHILRSKESIAQKDVGDYGLTKRELQVLGHIVKGLTYQEIAQTLVVSPLTVRSHMENLYRKLGAHNKAEAIALALRNNWEL